jgi:phage virion morphogenesis protein
MMITIKIDSEQLQKELKKLLQLARDRRPLMKNIAGMMHNAVEENFAQEGRPKWIPLSPKTIAARQKKGYWPGQILQQTGRLAASITQYADNDQAVVGTNAVYAAIHQFGGKAGRGKKVNIPARPYLQLTDEDMEEILKAVKEYLKLD